LYLKNDTWSHLHVLAAFEVDDLRASLERQVAALNLVQVVAAPVVELLALESI
jgi:hypothetical protein